MDGTGHEAIDALAAGAQQQFPGFRFRQLGAVDGHHDYVRFSWELGPDGASAPIAGSVVQQVIQRMAESGCDAVVLGCTELPLLAADAPTAVPTLSDDAALHLESGHAGEPCGRAVPVGAALRQGRSR